MHQFKPVTQDMDTVEVDDSLANLVTRVSQTDARVLLEKHGEPVAAIISIDEMRRFDRLEEARKNDFAVFDRIEAAFADVPTEEIEAAADRAIARARANKRAEAARD